MVHKGNIPWNKGKTGIYSEETRRRLSESHKGMVPSKETINKRRLAMQGKKHSEETKLMISKANKGRKHSEEFRMMRREIMLGKKQSEETKRKKSESLRKFWSDQFLREGAIQKMKRFLLDNPQKEEERRRKIKEAYANPEFKKRISKQRKGKHHSLKSEFKKGLVPWNKGLKGVMPVPWNKGKVGLQVAWNRGKKGINPNKGILHHTEEAILKIKVARARQVFPIKDSKPEIITQNFLRQLGIDFFAHKSINIKHGYQCDILIPSMNLIIEIDGDYWHGNTDNPRYKILNSSQIKQRAEDNLRTKELIEKGFKVLRLWESDIRKMTFNDFKKKIDSLEKV